MSGIYKEGYLQTNYVSYRKTNENSLCTIFDGIFVQRYHRLNNPLLSSRQPTFSGVFSSGMNTEMIHNLL